MSVVFAASLVGCGDSAVDEPSATASAHSDEVLLDRAIGSLSEGREAEAMILLQTLVDSFPESKLANGVSSVLDQCSRDEECAALLPADCGGLTFFPSLESTDRPQENGSKAQENSTPSDRRNECLVEYKD
jgi:hypothetical protein